MKRLALTLSFIISSLVVAEMLEPPKWAEVPPQNARIGMSYFIDLINFVKTQEQHPVECIAPELPDWLFHSGCELAGRPGNVGVYEVKMIARDYVTKLESIKTIKINVTYTNGRRSSTLCWSSKDCSEGYCHGANTFSPGYCKSVPVGPG